MAFTCRFKIFQTNHNGLPYYYGAQNLPKHWQIITWKKNIIITRNEDFKIEGAEIYQSLNAAISECDSEKVFVIGGAEIYTLAMPMIKELYITIVKNKFDADTFFRK